MCRASSESLDRLIDAARRPDGKISAERLRAIYTDMLGALSAHPGNFQVALQYIKVAEIYARGCREAGLEHKSLVKIALVLSVEAADAVQKADAALSVEERERREKKLSDLIGRLQTLVPSAELPPQQELVSKPALDLPVAGNSNPVL